MLGGPPQHTRMPEKLGRLVLGSHNTIRENCTVHRALHEGTATTIGDDNLLMVGAHVAHDCTVGIARDPGQQRAAGRIRDRGDRAFVSGAVAVHQFCRIGRLAMIGGCARVVQDVPPYVMVDGHSGLIVGLNLVGLRRNGYKAEDVAQLKAAYRLIYRRGLRWIEVLETIETGVSHRPRRRLPPVSCRKARGASSRNGACRRPPRSNLRRAADDEGENRGWRRRPAKYRSTARRDCQRGGSSGWTIARAEPISDRSLPHCNYCSGQRAGDVRQLAPVRRRAADAAAGGAIFSWPAFRPRLPARPPAGRSARETASN